VASLESAESAISPNYWYWADGTKAWYLAGKRHKEDGPAVEFPDGTKEWWYHGNKIECSSTEEFTKVIAERATNTGENHEIRLAKSTT
jgi:hypothetical protein